jgi:hypothetical protein
MVLLPVLLRVFFVAFLDIFWCWRVRAAVKTIAIDRAFLILA